MVDTIGKTSSNPQRDELPFEPQKKLSEVESNKVEILGEKIFKTLSNDIVLWTPERVKMAITFASSLVLNDTEKQAVQEKVARTCLEVLNSDKKALRRLIGNPNSREMTLEKMQEIAKTVQALKEASGIDEYMPIEEELDTRSVKLLNQGLAESCKELVNALKPVLEIDDASEWYWFDDVAPALKKAESVSTPTKEDLKELLKAVNVVKDDAWLQDLELELEAPQQKALNALENYEKFFSKDRGGPSPT